MTDIKVSLDLNLVSDAIKIIANAIHPKVEHSVVASVINELQAACQNTIDNKDKNVRKSIYKPQRT